MSAPENPTHDVTLLLRQWSAGDSSALERLTPLVYAEMRQLAGAYMSRERQGHTLQPTALLNEAWLRLAGQPLPDFHNRSHFYGVVAQLMRQALVDSARARESLKRGGGQRSVTLQDAEDLAVMDSPASVVELDRALDRLEQIDSQKARIVELHYFAGFTVDEIAAMMDVSSRTIARQLRFAKAVLSRELGGREG